MRNDQQNAPRFLCDEYAVDSSDQDGRGFCGDDRNKHRLRTSDESNGAKPTNIGSVEPAEPAEPRTDDEHGAGCERR